MWLALAVGLAYRGIRWQWPGGWAAGHFEWMRGVSIVTGLVGVFVLEWRRDMRDVCRRRRMHTPEDFDLSAADIAIAERVRCGRPDCLAGMLVASMSVDLTAMLIRRGTGQWGPQPFFQVVVLLTMCAVSAWPRRKS
jgi:hypothetical protein